MTTEQLDALHRRHGQSNYVNSLTSEVDRLRGLLERCHTQLVEHDSDYQHTTPADLMRELEKVLGE
jgi:hypothetical protein